MNNISYATSITRYSLFTISLFFFPLYFFTLSIHPNWGDSAKLIIFTRNLQFSSDSGYHNLLLLLYYPFIYLPSDNLAFKINLANMFYSILTLLLFFTLLIRQENSIKTSILLTFAMGFSHLFWHLSVITESYNLTVLFLVLCLIFLTEYQRNPEPYKLYLFFFSGGLGIQVNLIFAPIFLILIFFLILHFTTTIMRVKIIIICSFVFLLSLLPTIIIITKEILSGSTFYETIVLNFLQQKYKSSFQFSALFDLKRISKIIGLFLYQFPSLLLLGILFIIYKLFTHKTSNPKSSIFNPPTGGQSSIFNLTALVTIILLTIVYTMPKSIYFLIFVSTFFLLLISKKINVALENIPIRLGFLLALMVVINIYSYITLPKYLSKRGIQVSRKVPFRDSNYYFLTPWKNNEKSSQDFYVFFGRIYSNDIVISDFTATEILLYYKHYGFYFPLTMMKLGKRFEIWDINEQNIIEKIKNNLYKKTIYFVGGAPEYDILVNNFVIEKSGELYKIIKSK